MLLMLFLAVALITAHLIMLWKTYRERVASWELYALRDQLRWAVINDERLLASPLFYRIDGALTGLAGNLREVSLWPLLPFALDRQQTDEEERRIWLCLAQPEYAPIAAVARDASKVFAKHLACRHLFLTALTVASVVGYFQAKRLVEGLSQAVITSVIRPPMSHPAIVDLDRHRAA
jgi:hypothetical protein